MRKKGKRGLLETEPIIDSRNEDTSEDEQENEKQPPQATCHMMRAHPLLVFMGRLMSLP